MQFAKNHTELYRQHSSKGVSDFNFILFMGYLCLSFDCYVQPWLSRNLNLGKTNSLCLCSTVFLDWAIFLPREHSIMSIDISWLEGDHWPLRHRGQDAESTLRRMGQPPQQTTPQAQQSVRPRFRNMAEGQL